MSLRSIRKLSVVRQLSTNEQTIMAALGLFVGLAGGYGAVGFRYLIDIVQSIAYGAPGELLDIIGKIPWGIRLAVPMIGGLAVGPMIYFFAREAKGHGVPEVMEAVALRNGLIRKRLVVVKSLASAITIGTGGSVGREGPIVQIGSAVGSSIGQLLKVSGDRMRTLVGCGAAAGIAATFNAPMAGAMFALEVILGDFGLATFSPIIISAVAATAISRHYLGDAPAFIVPHYELVSRWEFPLYVILGVFCALVALAFIKLLYKTEDLFDAFKFPEYFKAIIGGLIFGLLGLFFPQILGVGYGGIDYALMQTYTWWLLLLLAALKLIATSITIGSGGSGGIFAPSLFLGVMVGNLFGFVVHTMFPGITATPGAYGIVGMAAVVSATTHGPLTAMLILFEMTGDYKIILPMMVTCIIATLVGRQILRESIYTLKMVRKGIDVQQGKEVNVLKSIPVKDVMNPGVDTVQESLTMGEFQKKVTKSKYNSFPVLDTAGRLTGVLSHIDYQDAVFDENLKDLVVVKELASSKVVSVSVEANLYDALEMISIKDYSILPVVSADDSGRLMGIVTRRDIVGAYTKAVLKKSLLAGSTVD